MKINSAATGPGSPSTSRSEDDSVNATPSLARRALTLLLLAGATFAAFAGVLRNGWILLDDPEYVTRNPHVMHGWSLEGLLWFLHQPHGHNWHPLTSCSHMLDVQLFGLDPAGHHAMSLALHILNALLVAIVLHRLTGAWWRSMLVAGLFALHPLRVESVAWISERKDLLSTTFLLLTLETYRRWTVRPGRWRWALVMITLALGLMSKPMLVTAPCLLVLLDLWPLGRLPSTGWWRRGRVEPRGAGAADHGRVIGAPPRSLAGLIAEKWPLFSMAVASAVVTFIVQRQGGAVMSVEMISLGRRVSNSLISYWRYVGMTLWPGHLAVFYPYGRSLDVAGAVLAAIGLVAVSGVVLWQARRRPYLSVGWFWYVGTLVPVIGLLQVGSQAYADRYTYIPSIGLLVAGVWGLAAIVSGSRAGRLGAAGVSVVALAVLGVATSHQVAMWKDTRTLYTQELAETHDNLIGTQVANKFLGQAFVQSGQIALAIPHLEVWLGLAPHFEDSLRRRLDADPADVETRRLLAGTLARETRIEEAIGEYRRILRADPNDLDALVNAAWIRATHEEATHRDGAEAVRLAERARDRSPEPVAVVYSTLAAAYAEAGRLPEAVRACERAIELARGAGEVREAQRYAQQLRCYRAGMPFHFGE
jgi:Flp pilus assembly protein TadD